MPRRDGSGPNGMGSRSGRGLGICTGVNAPRNGFGGGFGNGYGGGYGMQNRNGFGMRNRNGSGFGFGGGRGAGPRWAAPGQGEYGSIETREALMERAEYMEAELAALRQRLTDMEQDRQE